MINFERYISLSSCFFIAKISRVHSGFRQYHLFEPNNGQLEEENMQVYARLGIRLLYKGRNKSNGRRKRFVILPSRLSYFVTIDPFKARRLLKSLSIKQGIKYDAPESAVDIAPFIALTN